MTRFRILVGLAVALPACGPASSVPTPTTTPVQPFPAQALDGARVPVFPLTYVVVEPSAGVDSVFASAAGRHKVDSILFRTLRERAPEVIWTPPDSLRRMSRQAPGLIPDPDQLATARMRTYGLQTIPEPLRAQLRTLTGAVSNGRYAVVPAGLTVSRTAEGNYVSDLTVVIADTRQGAVGWSNTLRGTAPDLWDAVLYSTLVLFP